MRESDHLALLVHKPVGLVSYWDADCGLPAFDELLVNVLSLRLNGTSSVVTACFSACGMLEYSKISRGSSG